MPRFFVAIDLPEEVKKELITLCCGLMGARWVPPEQLHLTLRFIGDVDGGRKAGIIEALSEVRGSSFSVRLAGVGFFPPRGNPNVLWAGVEKNEELLRLQKRIEAGLVRSGLEPEKRKFHPHVTLARLRETPIARAGRYLSLHSLFGCPEFMVEGFTLYSSILGRNGAKHYPEERYLFPTASLEGLC